MCLFTPQREDSSKKPENDDGIESCGRNDQKGTSQDEVSNGEGKNRKQDSHPQLKNSFLECFGLWGRCYRKGTALLSL